MSEIFLRDVDYGAVRRIETATKQIPSKISDVFKIIYVVQGNLECWLGSKHYKIEAKNILVVPKELMIGGNVRVKTKDTIYFDVWLNEKMLCALTQKDKDTTYLFDQAQSEQKFLVTLDAEKADYLQSTLEQLVRECVSNDLNAGLMSQAMLYLSLIIINRNIYEKDGFIMYSGETTRLSAVAEYIKENCKNTLTVEGLAEKFGYSESNLAHSFKKQMGTSLYHYILLYRLQMGRIAMLSGVPIKEAYECCGFGDYAGFYRAFTKEFGISPQKYKKKYQP